MTVKIGDRFETLKPIAATLWWSNDDLGVVDEEWYAHDSELPIGTILTVYQHHKENSANVLTLADKWRRLRKLLPKRSQYGSTWLLLALLLGSRLTQFLIEVSVKDLESSCRHIGENPSVKDTTL